MFKKNISAATLSLGISFFLLGQGTPVKADPQGDCELKCVDTAIKTQQKCIREYKDGKIDGKGFEDCMLISVEKMKTCMALCR